MDNSYEKRISLHTRYDKYYHINVQNLFNFLPELFTFVEQHNIIFLDFSYLSNYGGYSEDISQFILQDKIYDTLQLLLQLIKKNTTLQNCNIGLFQNYLTDLTKIEDIIKNHHNLKWINIRATNSTTYFNKLPTTIWKKNNGEMVWSHFKPSD